MNQPDRPQKIPENGKKDNVSLAKRTYYINTMKELWNKINSIISDSIYIDIDDTQLFNDDYKCGHSTINSFCYEFEKYRKILQGGTCIYSRDELNDFMDACLIVLAHVMRGVNKKYSKIDVDGISYKVGVMNSVMRYIIQYVIASNHFFEKDFGAKYDNVVYMKKNDFFEMKIQITFDLISILSKFFDTFYNGINRAEFSVVVRPLIRTSFF